MKIAFKKSAAVLLLFVLLLTAGGCGKKKESLSPASIVQQLQNNYRFSSMNSLSGDKLSSYFQFSNADVKRFDVRIDSTGNSADIIACFEYTSEENKHTIISGITEYLNNKSAIFKGTLQTEYEKLQTRVLMDLDNTITLVVCDRNEDVEKELTQMGATVVS